MKRTLIALLVLALAATSLAAAASQGGVTVPVAQEQSVQKALNTMYTKAQLASGKIYVGTDTCLSCHNFTRFPLTYHPTALRRPMAMYTLQPQKGVLANSLGGSQDDFIMGLDFNTKTGTPFDALKPNAPILSYSAANDTYWIQLGPSGLKIQVVATWAGNTVGNGQRFICRIPVSDIPTGSVGLYFAPLAWSGTGYSSNASNWYNGNTPKYAPGLASSALVPLQGQNWKATCSGCHITGIKNVGTTAAGEMYTTPYPGVIIPKDSPNYPDLVGDGKGYLGGIGCESCHGPGSAHVAGGGDITQIVNPNDITNNQQRSWLCLQCHVQTGSYPTKKWGFTFDEVNNKPYIPSVPMEPLTNYQVSKAVKWPDGIAYSTARIDSFYSSAHYQGSHGIACNDCHNAHRVTNNGSNQVRDSITRSGVKYTNTNIEDNSFCMSCHHAPYFMGSYNITAKDVQDWKASGFEAPIPNKIRAAIEAHTHHPYGAANPDGSPRMLGQSRCITCHMATSHTFWPSAPEDTIKFKDSSTSATVKGNINSCSAACHRGQVISWSDVPANLTYTNNLYNTADELKLAGHLEQYFGPGGEWWDTSAAAKATKVQTK